MNANDAKIIILIPFRVKLIFWHMLLLERLVFLRALAPLLGSRLLIVVVALNKESIYIKKKRKRKP